MIAAIVRGAVAGATSAQASSENLSPSCVAWAWPQVA
jgi:hypothetical protein